jgi:amino acid permease
MHNLLLLLGTTIGAGIFTLPITLAKSGFLIYFFLLALLAWIMAKVNWFYKEVIGTVKERHQLGGYVRQILGPGWALAATVLLLFSTVGALLAYLILAGNFISAVTPLNSTQASWAFYFLVFLLLYFGGRRLEVLDIFVTVVKLLLLCLVIIITFSLNEATTAVSLQLNQMHFKEVLIAYGSVLFALTGYSIVPELRRDKTEKKAISLAQAVVALFYFLFALSLLRFVQNGEFAINNNFQRVVFNITGIFTVLTPYLMLSWVGYDVFDKDLGFPKKEALILILILPLLFYLIGFHDFLAVISISGGVFLGIIGFLIAKMYRKKFPTKNKLLVRVIQLIFIAGAVAEIATLF